MKKRILMIGYNYAPEPTGIGKYSGEMMIWLSQNGYDCTVITTYPYYPYWKVQEPYHKGKWRYKKEIQDTGEGGKIKIFRCPMYVPAQPTGLKRILLDLSFLITAFIQLVQLLPGKKFDYVITVVPSFQFGLLGILYKKLRKSKLFYHIHDLQIEAARDLKMIKSERLIKFLFRMEKYIFNQTDFITCTGEGMVRKTQEKVSEEVFHFPNWADNKAFFPIGNKEQLKEEFGFSAKEKIFLYSGAIGEKQGVETILHSANELRGVEGLKFVICGSGPYKEKLQKLAEDLNLQNVVFYPLQPFEKFNRFLNCADVHLVVQKANACDLVTPSKLTTILSVGGLALVTANKGSGLHTLVDDYQIGLLVDAENQAALTKGILQAFEAKAGQVQKNAKFYAENFLSIDRIMGWFKDKLEGGKRVPIYQVEALPSRGKATKTLTEELPDPVRPGSNSLKKEKPIIFKRSNVSISE